MFTAPEFWSGETYRAKIKTPFEMTVSANMAVGLLKLLAKNQDQRDSIDYELNGKVSIDLPFMRSIPFHQNGAYSLKGKSFSGS